MRHCLLGGVLLCAALPAHAVDWSDWYVLGAVSQSRAELDRPALDATLASNGASGLSSGDTGTSNQWRVQLGYTFSPYLSVEGGYIDLGKAEYDATFSGGRALVEWQSGGIDLAALGTLELDHGFAVLGKVGIISTRTTSSWSSVGLSGLPVGDVDKSQTRPFFGIGASYGVTPNSSVRLEYERFNDIGDAGLTGNADINTFSLGASYQF